MQAVERCINDAEAAAQMAATAKDGDADTCASALEPGYLLWTVKRVGTLHALHCAMHHMMCDFAPEPVPREPVERPLAFSSPRCTGAE